MSGAVVARTSDGEGTLCHTDAQDPAMHAFFVGGQIEPVGKRGHITLKGEKRSWTNR